MDPTNPRWDTSDVRFRRQKLFWSLIATGAALTAATTMVVVSCLDRTHAQRDPAQVTIVETTASPPTPSPAPATTIVINPVVMAPPATNDSTGGAGPTGTTNVTSAPLPAPVEVTAPAATMVTPPGAVAAPVIVRQAAPPAPARQPTDTSSGIPTAPTVPSAPPAGVPPSATSPSLSPTTSPDANSSQVGPRFSTDSPPWNSSSWVSNPDAGAGAFPPPQ